MTQRNTYNRLERQQYQTLGGPPKSKEQPSGMRKVADKAYKFMLKQKVVGPTVATLVGSTKKAVGAGKSAASYVRERSFSNMTKDAARFGKTTVVKPVWSMMKSFKNSEEFKTFDERYREEVFAILSKMYNMYIFMYRMYRRMLITLSSKKRLQSENRRGVPSMKNMLNTCDMNSIISILNTHDYLIKPVAKQLAKQHVLKVFGGKDYSSSSSSNGASVSGHLHPPDITRYFIKYVFQQTNGGEDYEVSKIASCISASDKDILKGMTDSILADNGETMAKVVRKVQQNMKLR